MNNEIQIILEKSRKIQGILPDYVKAQYVPPSQEENEQKKMVREFNRGDSLAPLIGTICDQEIDTDTAWSIPLHLSNWLKSRAMDFKASTIANLGESKIKNFLWDFMKDKWPSKMRKEKRKKWLENMSTWIIESCKKVRDSYENNLDNLFKIMNGKLSPPLIYLSLRKFKGIGPKKASMVARDFALGMWDWYEGVKERLDREGVELDVKGAQLTDTPIDVHVKRVFKRVGLVQWEAMPSQDYQNLVKLIYPEAPGAVDILVWNIGKEYCKNWNPNCSRCVLNNTCDYYKPHQT